MSPDASVAVVVLVEKPCSGIALQRTLESVAWASQFIVADSAGITMPETPLKGELLHYPWIGLPLTVLRYRSALAATFPYLLFLTPGDVITPAVRDKVTNLVEMPPPDLAVAFPKQVIWQDITWIEAADVRWPHLVDRDAFLSGCHLARFPQVTAGACVMAYHLDEKHALTSFLQDASYQDALNILAEKGAASLCQTLMQDWIREVMALGLGKGVFQGRLFHPAQRISLFIQLVRAHLKCFSLYEITRSLAHPGSQYRA